MHPKRRSAMGLARRQDISEGESAVIPRNNLALLTSIPGAGALTLKEK